MKRKLLFAIPVLVVLTMVVLAVAHATSEVATVPNLVSANNSAGRVDLVASQKVAIVAIGFALSAIGVAAGLLLARHFRRRAQATAAICAFVFAGVSCVPFGLSALLAWAAESLNYGCIYFI